MDGSDVGRIKTSHKNRDDVKERRIGDSDEVDKDMLNVMDSLCLEIGKMSGIDIATVNFSRNMSSYFIAVTKLYLTVLISLAVNICTARFNKKVLYPQAKLWVFYGCQNKERLFPYTTLTGWFLELRRSVFTAWYGLGLYI